MARRRQSLPSRVISAVWAVVLGLKGPAPVLPPCRLGFWLLCAAPGFYFLFLESRHGSVMTPVRRCRQHKSICFGWGRGLRPQDQGEALSLLRLMVAEERDFLQCGATSELSGLLVATPVEHWFIKTKQDKTKQHKTKHHHQTHRKL